MAVLLDNGELKLDSEECAKLKLPADSVIPADSAEEIQGRLQEFEDEEVRKLFRGLGPSPDEEPYEGKHLPPALHLARRKQFRPAPARLQ